MENLNSVAFIAKIKEIKPIEGADKIEQVICEGWSSVSSKGTHKVGDLVLCITTDAVIPEHLATKWGVIGYLRKGNRVRTVKLKGVYSECILISSNDVNQSYIEILNKKHDYLNWILGHDCMEDFGIYKYEPPVKIVQDSKGRKHKYHQNPNFHIYHKFPNQKNTPNMFNEDDDVVITRKIHGSNFRASVVKKHKLSIFDKIKKFFGNKYAEYTFAYGSHNVEKGSDNQGYYSTDVWKEMCDKYDIRNRLWEVVKLLNLTTIGDGIIIYGEVYGPGIQGDKYTYGLKERELVMFDIELNNEYLNQTDKESIFYILNLPMVEKLYQSKWSKEIQDKYSKSVLINNTNIYHEGVIVSHISGDRNKIYKIISPEYLIQGEKINNPDNH